MKKSILILLAAILLISFSSSARDYGTSSYQYDKTMSRSECQTFLECFCIKNYNSMFDRYYFKNSLIINNVRVFEENGWKTFEVRGIHSFKNSITHNDDDFKATIRDKGNDKYEVTISLRSYARHIPLYWMSATRVFYY